MKDPFDDGPEVLGTGDPLINSAREIAEQLAYLPDTGDPRGLNVLGTAYTFSSSNSGKDALIEARFRMTRALVSFARAERDKERIAKRVWWTIFGGLV